MIAESSLTGVTWTSVGAAVVFVLTLAALAVDRVRMKQRLAALERSAALLETDLADARAEVEGLRDCLRATPQQRADVPRSGASPGDPTAPVG